MARRQTRQGLVLGVSLLALVGFGCTPQTTPPPPPPQTATSPAESAQEREERLAYEAAEKSYREFSLEFRRITARGGAAAATPKMKSSAAGPYLANAVKVIKAYKDTGGYTKGTVNFGYIRPAGYSPDSLILDVCEDERSVQTYNSKNKRVATNGILILQLEVKHDSGTWKVWDYTGKEAESCA